MRKITKGWFLCVKQKGDFISVVRLKDLKEPNALDVAEYTITNKLVIDPTFQWWVPTTIRRRDRIIYKIHIRCMKRQKKFGIDLLKNFQEAYQLDNKNGNTKWADAISKEMKNIRIAFTIIKNEAKTPIKYQKIHCRIFVD